MRGFPPVVASVVLGLMSLRGAVGQTLLYEETFPYPGPSGGFPVSVVGWANAIPNNLARLYQVSGSDGAVYAYQANGDVPITTAFYTTTGLDPGATGMAFPSVSPALYSGVAFSVDIQPYYTPDKVVSRFAVQMNGTSWYAFATALPVPTVVGGFVSYTQAFSTNASAWNTLTLNGTSATIGGAALAGLTGQITGTGLAITHTLHAGTHNFDNFRITGTVLAPSIAAQPENWTANPCETVQFSVGASGTPPLFYQWRKGGSPVSNGGNVYGATSNTITITNVGPGDAGSYSVIITNSLGVTNSNPAALTVSGIGGLVVSCVSNGVVTLSWSGGPQTRLQSSTNVVSGTWQDVPNTRGQSLAVLAAGADEIYFRLMAAPSGIATSPYQLTNGGFEADGSPAASPSGWSTTGDASADAVISGDAQTGMFSLQHSNAVAYHVENSQLVTGLTNGYYKLSAWAKSSGGQNACYLSGKDKITSLPPITQSWTEMVVRGVAVTNGQCLVRIVSDSAASNWCRVDNISLVRDDISYNFLKGGDISELTYVEQGGGKFYETNGVQMDCLQILKNHGFNSARLRLYNDPGNANYSPSNLLPPGIQSPTNILNLAARAKAQGMQLELTIYYSDYWTNGKPHDWVGFTFPQLTNAVYTFTTNFMTQMKNQGTTPEYVSLGNEIGGGILLPDGSSGNFPQLAQLLQAGYAGVKAVSPSSQVILHLGNVDVPSVEWFFNQCLANGVQWDVIGCSYYPFWTGLTSEQARTNINQFYTLYNKPVLIMETGYNWSTNACDGWPGQLSDNGPETFPSTRQGQKNFLLKCFNDLKLVAGGHCIGDLYWDPIFICVPGQGWQLGARNVVDNTTLFDFTGHALPSLDAFYYNN